MLIVLGKPRIWPKPGLRLIIKQVHLLLLFRAVVFRPIYVVIVLFLDLEHVFDILEEIRLLIRILFGQENLNSLDFWQVLREHELLDLVIWNVWQLCYGLISNISGKLLISHSWHLIFLVIIAAQLFQVVCAPFRWTSIQFRNLSGARAFIDFYFQFTIRSFRHRLRCLHRLFGIVFRLDVL